MEKQQPNEKTGKQVLQERRMRDVSLVRKKLAGK